MTLDQWVGHFNRIYARNNSVYVTSLHEKLGLLLVTTRTLQDVIRKNQGEEKQARALAHTLAWVCAVVNHFEFPSFAQYLCEKYPAERCGYCLKKPCGCDPRERREHHVTVFNPVQLGWGIREWQTHFKETYGAVNEQKGIWDILDRLFTEIAEVHAILAGNFIGEKASDIEHEYGFELADVVAWLMAAGTTLRIDLETATQTLYGAGCPCCGYPVCDCRKFTVIEGKIVHVPTVYSIPNPVI